MGVDFVQDRDCRVKRELGLDRLVGLLKSRGQAAMLARKLEESGEDPEMATIRRVVLYPSGPVEEEVRMADLMKAGAVLEPFAPLCEGCTANFREAPFGCCGYLNYPISNAEEQWLMERLPRSTSCVAWIYLRAVLRELKIDGAPVARLRGELYFERDEPVVRTWDTGGEQIAVTSDQILHLLFYTGPVSPLQAVFVALFTGLVPHDITPEEMQAIVQDPPSMQHHLALPPDTVALLEDTQLGTFLMALMSAAINEEILLIDA